MTINFPKIIDYYTKVVTKAERQHGIDWRSEMYRERLQRVTDLSKKSTLSEDDVNYLEARQAVAEVF